MPSLPTSPQKIKGVSDYLKAISFRDNRLWEMVGGVLITQVNGEYMSSKEFDEKFPVPTPISFGRCQDNPDKTKMYLM